MHVMKTISNPFGVMSNNISKMQIQLTLLDLSDIKPDYNINSDIVVNSGLNAHFRIKTHVFTQFQLMALYIMSYIITIVTKGVLVTPQWSGDLIV